MIKIKTLCGYVEHFENVRDVKISNLTSSYYF